ncbi:MAG TPA: peptidoglycan endopeptidase [Allosphingosinicella sp.]|nr:peptidoglycan endopeptidase [Allosphingosinicella sp.]
MRRRAEEIVAAGRALIGVRFRPQGRSIEHGLDCIGVVAMATGRDARRVRRDYDMLASRDPEEVKAEFEACGFIPVAPGEIEPGDILLVNFRPGHLHAAILTPDGYLHADARLRRVVEVPGEIPWPILSAWRVPEDGVVAVRLH